MERNTKQREAIRHQIEALTAAMEAAQDAADQTIADNDAWSAEDARITAEYQPRIDALFAEMKRLQYPTVKNEWFRDVFIPSFRVGCQHISSRQAAIIAKYATKAYYNDSLHCTAGNRFVTLAGNQLLIEQI